jgi:uncharacterized protein (DUF58 family)
VTATLVTAAADVVGRERRHMDAEALLKRLDWHVVRRLDGILQGDYRSLFTGHGFDLAEVREYQPEDDVRYMDWNVTARMGEPFVRQYIEDREITAWLLLDLSPSVQFGTLLFSSSVDELVPPRGGQVQTLRILHQLVRPDRAEAAGVTDLPAVLDRAAETLRRRSLVFIVSDFIASGDWEAPLARLAQRHEVLAVWLSDPREEVIPPIGWLVLEDAETGQQVYVDTSDPGFQRRFASLVEKRKQAIARIFARHGVDVLRLSTDGDLVWEVARFAHLRRESRRRASGAAGGGPF